MHLRYRIGESSHLCSALNDVLKPSQSFYGKAQNHILCIIFKYMTDGTILFRTYFTEYATHKSIFIMII